MKIRRKKKKSVVSDVFYAVVQYFLLPSTYGGISGYKVHEVTKVCVLPEHEKTQFQREIVKSYDDNLPYLVDSHRVFCTRGEAEAEAKEANERSLSSLQYHESVLVRARKFLEGES